MTFQDKCKVKYVIGDKGNCYGYVIQEGTYHNKLLMFWGG